MIFAELSPAAAEAILVVWLLAIGGAVGSFLNVVIYRLPAGKSIVLPRSHCPACQHPIRWHDNLPVLSWFLLRARCRDCACRISVRYPLVEAGTAAVFGFLGVFEGLSRGANLPLAPLAADSLLLPPLGVGQSAGIVTYHLLLLCTLLAAVLIEYDGHPLPGRLFAPALAAGWLGPIAWPDLHPVPAWPELRGSIGGLASGTAGLGAGLLLGLAASRVIRGQQRGGLTLAAACVGLFLGWQAAVALTGVTAVCHLLFSAARKWWPTLPSVPSTAWLGLASLIWVVAWGQLVSRWPVLG